MGKNENTENQKWVLWHFSLQFSIQLFSCESGPRGLSPRVSNINKGTLSIWKSGARFNWWKKSSRKSSRTSCQKVTIKNSWKSSWCMSPFQIWLSWGFSWGFLWWFFSNWIGPLLVPPREVTSIIQTVAAVRLHMSEGIDDHHDSDDEAKAHDVCCNPHLDRCFNKSIFPLWTKNLTYDLAKSAKSQRLMSPCPPPLSFWGHSKIEL